MLKIRLQRVGRKHEPTFRVVLTDSKNSTKSGKFHEILGFYDPRKKGETVDGNRIKEWVSKGAQLSDTVYNLLVSHNIIEGKKKNVLPRKAPYKTEAKLAEEKAQAEAEEAKRQAEIKAKEEAEAKAKEEAEQAAAQAESPVEETPAAESAPAEEVPAVEESPAVEETTAETTPSENS